MSAFWAGAVGATEFLVNPIIGRLSDKYGRKQNLLMGPLSNVLLKSLVAINPSVATIALERILCGCFTTVSGSTTCFAVLSDLTSGQDLALSGTTLGAYMGLGCVLGPLLGGDLLARTKSARVSFAVRDYMSVPYALISPLKVAALIAAIDFSLTLNMYEETLSKAIEFDWSAVHPLRFLRLFEGSSTMTKLVFVAGLLCFPEGKNLSDFNQIFILNHVKFSQKMRTLFTAGFGASIFVGGVVARRMLLFLGQRGHTTASCIMSMAGLSLWAAKPTPLNMFIGLAIMTFGMERRAAVTAMTSREASKIGIGRGEFAGLFANWRAIATCFAPILYGRVYQRVYTKSPGLPYMVAGMFAIAGECLHRTMSDKELGIKCD